MAAPVKHTCPEIDRVIKSIREAIKIAGEGRKHTEDRDTDDMFKEIEFVLDGLEYKMEDLRSSNDALRTWGHELEKELETVKDELESVRAESFA